MKRAIDGDPVSGDQLLGFREGHLPVADVAVQSVLNGVLGVGRCSGFGPKIPAIVGGAA
jgi:hypothetical protein